MEDKDVGVCVLNFVCLSRFKDLHSHYISLTRKGQKVVNVNRCLSHKYTQTNKFPLSLSLATFLLSFLHHPWIVALHGDSHIKKMCECQQTEDKVIANAF